MKEARASAAQDWPVIVLLLAAAAAVRLDFLFAGGFVIDADEGIVGLMAKHILEGKSVPAFYYGQHYMGSLEAILAAGMFKLFGVFAAALKAVPLLFSLIFVVLVYLLGFELQGRGTARLAALFAALPPSALVVWSGKARGGFMEVVVIGSLAFWLLLRWLKTEPPRVNGTFLMGLLLGLGWWVNNQIIYFMLAVGLAVLCRLVRAGPRSAVRLGQHGVAGTAGFFLGGLPFWVYNLNHDFASFGIFGRAGAGDALRHLEDLFTIAWPIILGAGRDWNTDDIFPYASLLAWLIYGGLLAFLLVVRRRKWSELLGLKLDAACPLEIFILFLAGICVVFSFSSFGDLAKSPRYILPSYAAIFVLAAAAIMQLRDRSRLLSTAAAAAIVLINLCSCYLGGRAVPGEPFVFEGQRAAKSHEALIAGLEQRGIEWVRTNYWIGYRLAFETGERIRFVLFGEPAQARIPEYEEAGAAIGPDRIPLLLVPAQTALVTEALRVLGYRFRLASVGGYDLVFDLKPGQEELTPLPHAGLRAHANYKPEHDEMAVDGDQGSRWGSAHPQTADMRFIVELEPPARVRALSYKLGEWRHDYPRGLEIELVLTSGERKVLLGKNQYQAVLYYGRAGAELTFFFEPLELKQVVLKQLGSHPVLDWSIAEIELYR